MTVLAGFVQTSATGAKSKLKCSAAMSEPMVRALLYAVSVPASLYEYMGPTQVVPSLYMSRPTFPPSSSAEMKSGISE